MSRATAPSAFPAQPHGASSASRCRLTFSDNLASELHALWTTSHLTSTACGETEGLVEARPACDLYLRSMRSW